jgi:hypothetical protein
MLLALVYFAVLRLLRLLTLGDDRAEAAHDIEILVLRHQLRVLSRGRRLRLRRGDRILLAAASRLLPRERWQSMLVSQHAVLRWPRVGKTDVDLPRQAATGSTEDVEGGGRTRPAARSGEPPLGLPAHPG